MASLPPDPFADMARLLSRTAVEVMIDGGAYHGEVAKQLADRFPSATVYAFEPHQESFNVLSAVGNLTERIEPCRLALSSTNMMRQLFCNAAGYTNALSRPSELCVEFFPVEARGIGEQSVETVALDDWTHMRKIDKVDVIKLDVQGHELEALRGAQRLLESSVRLVYTEVEFVRLYEDSCMFAEIDRFLAEFGFSLFQLYHINEGRTVSPGGQLVYGDAIFLNRDRLG